jgi:hypothetical protein
VADIGLFCQRQLDYGVPFGLHISVRDADKHNFVAVPLEQRWTSAKPQRLIGANLQAL